MTTPALSDELKSLLDAYALALAENQAGEAARLAGQIRELWQRKRPSEAELRELEALLHPEKWLKPVPDVPAPESKGKGWSFLENVDLLNTTRSAAASASTLFPVWFGTNREPNDPADYSQGFGWRRSNDIHRGRVDVAIPDNRRLGELGTPWWKRWLRLQFQDDHLRIEQTLPLDETSFRAQLQAALNEGREAGESHALVFIHGFNVSFQEAALRAAQLGYDLKVAGPTAFFSWPSRASLRGYPSDAASIEASEDEIARFLRGFAEDCAPAKVHLIAHSMGNRGLLRALQRIAADTQAQAGLRFGQIFLAAPDVDRDLFLDLARLYQRYSERATLYASPGDRAVWTSEWLHQAPRAGYLPPVTLCPEVNTIAVPNFDFDLLGHGYFAENPGPLRDMFTLIRQNLEPDNRQGLQAVHEAGGKYWRFTG